jgi:hypothetical protein
MIRTVSKLHIVCNFNAQLLAQGILCQFRKFIHRKDIVWTISFGTGFAQRVREDFACDGP